MFRRHRWTCASSRRCWRWPRRAASPPPPIVLHTVQSNVSEHVRQLEAELGVQLLVRGRRGTVPTEFGVRVIERARAIRSEIEALHKDLSMLQGLETGHATLGVVGTVSRLLVPMVVAEMRTHRARRVAAPHRRRVGTARGRGRRAPARERGRDRAGQRSAAARRAPARRGPRRARPVGRCGPTRANRSRWPSSRPRR